MRRTLTALFDDYDDAAKVVRRLEDAGISYRDISIVANAPDVGRHVVPLGTTDDAVTAAGAGMAAGTAIGGGAGLLAALGLITIPGLGPVVAAGWLVAAIGGAAAGAATGGLVGVLVGAGVSEEDANIYSEGLRRGGTLVVCRIDEQQYEIAQAILARSRAADMAARTDAPSASEWSGASGAGASTEREETVGEHRTGGAAQFPSNPLIESDRVEGTAVYDPHGTYIGAVKRLMIEKVSGRVAYVVMSFGGILGLGEETHLIPWGALTYDVHLQGYRTSITEDQVRGAPVFYRDPNWNWSDRERERAFHDHYGAKYYWDE